METQTTAPQTPADRAGTVGNETKQATKDVAATAGQEAKQVTREAKDQVRQLWGQTRSDLTNQASTQQTRAASGLRELADQLGQMAGAADSDGMAKGLVEDVSRRAHDAAQWLDSRDPGSLLEEARSFARQRPGTFLAIAAGVGVLAGRLSRGLVDEARDSDSSSGTGTPAYGAADYGTSGYATTSGGYGTGSLGATGSTAGTGIPTATSPTTSTTESTPITPGALVLGPVRGHGHDAVRGPARAAPHHPAPRHRRHAEPHRRGRPPDRGGRRRPARRPMTEQQGYGASSGATMPGDTRNGLPDPSLRSVGEVLGDITSDLSTLLRQEVELAKAELRETADHAKAAGGMFAGAGVAGHLALIFLSLALWWALGDLFDSLGWSALVVGLLWAVAAGVLASVGRTRLKRATPVAPRTVDTAKDIPEALKGHETR